MLKLNVCRSPLDRDQIETCQVFSGARVCSKVHCYLANFRHMCSDIKLIPGSDKVMSRIAIFNATNYQVCHFSDISR